MYELTDAGRDQLEELGERAQAPWDLGDGDPVGARDLAEQMAQLAGAFKQVIHHGSPAQIAKAGTVLADARRGALPDPRRRGPGRHHRIAPETGHLRTRIPSVSMPSFGASDVGVEGERLRHRELDHAELEHDRRQPLGPHDGRDRDRLVQPEVCTAMRTNSVA